MGGLVWLAWYPKSANTWMRNFIDNALSSGDETHAIAVDLMDNRDSPERRPF